MADRGIGRYEYFQRLDSSGTVFGGIREIFFPDASEEQVRTLVFTRVPVLQ